MAQKVLQQRGTMAIQILALILAATGLAFAVIARPTALRFATCMIPAFSFLGSCTDDQAATAREPGTAPNPVEFVDVTGQILWTVAVRAGPRR
jgi:hypothetical protein